MLKRLFIYFKERYPFPSMLLVAIIAFAEIHFIILLNNGVTDFSLGVQEAVGIFTVFSFLMWLRVADDLKDYETDKKLNSTYRVFDLLDFVGIVEYNTNNSDSILLVKNGSKYYEFPNYENDGGKLTITITEDDNYTDFVITTKENFENYKKGE